MKITGEDIIFLSGGRPNFDMLQTLVEGMTTSDSDIIEILGWDKPLRQFLVLEF
jgi:hypothetical protein